MGKLNSSSVVEMVRSLGEVLLGYPASTTLNIGLLMKKTVHDVIVPEHLCAIINIAEGCRGQMQLLHRSKGQGKALSAAVRRRLSSRPVYGRFGSC